MNRLLYVVRHAEAVPYGSGGHDRTRPLTDAGRRQAVTVAERLRGLIGEMTLERVLCSPSVRTRQTLEPIIAAGLAVGEPEYVDAIYDAGSDTLVELIRAEADEVRAVLLVGHAPGVPGLCWDLADVETSDAGAIETLERGYPAATLARMELTTAWPDLASGGARLTDLVVTR